MKGPSTSDEINSPFDDEILNRLQARDLGMINGERVFHFVDHAANLQIAYDGQKFIIRDGQKWLNQEYWRGYVDSYDYLSQKILRLDIEHNYKHR
ncbi:hypothetical protein [Fibrivirga algicola]|uniref:Uncharacterized protein n=1 Tax=Fibrivirga algicola TaxID=2950420 RepID=A0ABX0QRL5_9BACT|nr:hypothetical protein [Fibrivirga algicola]NID13800.1 hypothetical protein [Fibrivirga algicola]